MRTLAFAAPALGALLALSSCATPREAVSPAPAPAPPKAQAVTAPAPKAPPAPKPVPFRPLQIPPPMDMVVLPVAHQPIVSFRLVFRAGSVDDPAGKEGLTALTAQLMAEGGTKSLSSAELLKALFPMAAELSATTDKELTVFEGRVHRDHLDRFLKIFTDVLLAPRFDPREFERLRADALNSIRAGLRGEDDEALGKVALDALLYPGHPYGHYVHGTVQGLSGLTLDDVKAHAARVFTQDRLVIGLAGGVDEALQRKVRERLSALPATGAPRAQLPPAPGIRGRAWVLQKDTLSTAVSIGMSTDVRRGDPDFYAMLFAASSLGEHRQFTGVLMQELREKRGMNYGDYAYAEHFLEDPGTTYARANLGRAQQDFSIWLRPVEPQNAVFAVRGALYFLQQFLTEDMSQERFDQVRGFLTGYSRLWEQTDQRRLGFAIDDRFYGTQNFLEGFRQAMARMTPAEVRAAANRHLSLEGLNFVFVTKDAKTVADLLARQPPTPIQYPTPKPPEVLQADKAIATQPIPVVPAAIEVKDTQQFMER